MKTITIESIIKYFFILFGCFFLIALFIQPSTSASPDFSRYYSDATENQQEVVNSISEDKAAAELALASLLEEVAKAENRVNSLHQSHAMSVVVLAQLKYKDTSVAPIDDSAKKAELTRLSEVAHQVRSSNVSLFQ